MTHDVRDVCTNLHTKQKQEEIANGEGEKNPEDFKATFNFKFKIN